MRCSAERRQGSCRDTDNVGHSITPPVTSTINFRFGRTLATRIGGRRHQADHSANAVKSQSVATYLHVPNTCQNVDDSLCGYNVSCATPSPRYAFIPLPPDLPSASFGGTTVPDEDNDDNNSKPTFTSVVVVVLRQTAVSNSCMENTQKLSHVAQTQPNYGSEVSYTLISPRLTAAKSPFSDAPLCKEAKSRTGLLWASSRRHTSPEDASQTHG